MTDEEKKFTQSDLDEAANKRLESELAKYADYDEIKAERDVLKAENTDLKAQVADQDGQLRDSQKIEAAKAAGLPEGLASRLQGETKEELEADAKRLAESMGPGPAVGAGTAPPSGAKKPLTRADVKKMSPEEITANMDQIKAQLKDGSLNRG